MSSRNRPLTPKEVSVRIAKFPDVILVGPYNGSNQKVKCKCRRCRHQWTPIWSNLMKGKGCPRCNLIRKTVLGIRDELNYLFPSIKILSKMYTGVYGHLKLQCTICNHKWSRSWHKLKSGVGCPQCQQDKQKLSIAEVKQKLFAISPSIVLLSCKYDNVKTPLKCACNQCHSTWISSWGCLRQGHGCPHCNFDNSKLEQEVRDVVESLTGKKFPRCRPSFTKGFGQQPLEIDCFNDELKLGIEANGRQHYQLCYHNKWNPKRLRAQQKRDWRKRYQCWYHGVKLISVPYWVKNVRSYLTKRLLPITTVKASL